MIKLLAQTPELHWFLMVLGFIVHVLLKMVNYTRKGKSILSFFTTQTVLSMIASLLMSAGMIMAGNYSFAGNEFLPFGALGAGYLNNSLWANLMQIVSSRANRFKEKDSE